MPTVHLGNVAHEMEKRGVHSDRGNINRDRQEYNGLIVDLQRYREEKQALEQEKARRQEEKQQVQRFNTPLERVHLQEASKLLNIDREPTLQELAAKQEQLDQWEQQVRTNDQQIQWKDNTIQAASDSYRSRQLFKKQRQQAQQKLESIQWFNPFKLKENRLIKEQAEMKIARATDEIKESGKRLSTYGKKLGFRTKQEFQHIQNQHRQDRPGLKEKNHQQTQQIHSEREVVQNAVTARQNAFIRQVQSWYPKHPEMAYMTFSDAHKLHALSVQHGKVLPIETIQATLHSQKQDIQRLQGELTRVDDTRSRLQRAEGYLKKYEKHHAMVEKIERNPYLKGKTLVSKSAKHEYKTTISNRNRYYDLMKSQGITGKTDLKKQKVHLSKMEERIPEIKGQIQSQEKAMSIFETIIQSLDQAKRRMQWEQFQQQQTLVRAKNKGKSRQRGWEMER